MRSEKVLGRVCGVASRFAASATLRDLAAPSPSSIKLHSDFVTGQWLT